MSKYTDPISFLLNRDTTDNTPAAGGDPVTSPAFSLTKVLSGAAMVVTPLAMLLVDKVTKLSFTSGQIVALTVAILGFLAIASAADVVARALAKAAGLQAAAVTTAATSRAQSRTAAADTRAQAWTAAAGARAQAVTAAAGAHSNGAESGVLLLLDKPLTARLQSDGLPKVTVVAVRGGSENRVLVAAGGGKLSWVDEKYVHYE
jgi:hypothetical protein